jgi:hypothetical protein
MTNSPTATGRADRAGLGAYVYARWLILAAVALLGVAHCALLPPFEEYDSVQYWSAVQQLADTGTIPVLGEAHLSADVDSYAGPLPDLSLGFPAAGILYRRFFATPAPVLQPVHRFYRPSDALNYEGQQPPFYFVAMAPAYLLARDWSWPNHFLFLRLVSWAFAFAGFTIGSLATMRLLEDQRVEPRLALLVPAWPILFPQFFPDMARIGNNGACLFFMGIAWALILRLLRGPDSKTAAGLGLTMGLGLLTKAFFVPITTGIALLFVYQAFRERDRRPLRDIAIALAVAVGIGGGWYLRNFLSSGSFMNLADFGRIGEQGGILSTLMAHGVSLHQGLHFIRGMAVIAATFVWGGTGTHIMLWPFLAAPVVLMAIIAFGAWLVRLRHWPVTGQAPLFVVGPFAAGLIYHQLVWVLTDPGSMAGTPGWHFHVLTPPLALALVLGWQSRRLLAGLASYAIAFHALCWATQASFFSGCAYRLASRGPLQLDPGSCLLDPTHLAVLGEPILVATTLVLAAAAGAAALFLVFHARPRGMLPR